MITGKSIQALKTNFSRESLRKLADEGEGQRLSLFMPLSKTGRDVRQAPILLKDMRSQAESALAAAGCRPDEINDILLPVNQLLEDTEFSVLQGEGLAILSSRENASTFLLPTAPAPMVETGRRYILDPLLPLLFEDGRFHLLTLSLNSVKLWWVDRHRMREVHLRGIPTSIRDFIQTDNSGAYVHYHVSSSPLAAPGGAGAIHGHGGGGKGEAKDRKRDILDFFRQVDRGLSELMHESELPLMLAGVEYLIPIYREANSLPRLLDQAVMGNPEVSLEQQSLHAKAWKAYRESRALEKARVLSLYRERLATPQSVSGLVEVLPAAKQGRIQYLFLRKGYRQKGAFHPEDGTVSFSDRAGPGEEDLVNLACIHALLTGAKVHILELGEIPEKADIAALCRY